MRRFIAIMGTLVIAAIIIICGSAVAAWYYAQSQTSVDCSNPGNAVGAPDDVYATLGQNGPPIVLGVITLDLGSGNEMNPSQDFTVFAWTEFNESYWVTLKDDRGNPFTSGWAGYDTMDLVFTTPSTPGKLWRYIVIYGTSGSNGDNGGNDTIYGPEIDAVGWESP